jgi:Family of unknown function (DUF5685)
MIGNINPYLSAQPDLFNSFMRPYCSLCKSLRQQYDLPTSLLLNYELSYILLSVDPYINASSTSTACPSSFFTKKKQAYEHPAIDKAARLSILLGWIKSIDFITDEKKKITSRWLMRMAEKKLGKRAVKILNEIHPNTKEAILAYVEVSKNSMENMDTIREKTYTLSSQVCYEIIVETSLPKADYAIYMDFFGQLGISIALLDPLLDLEKDLEKDAYNPILEAYSKNGTELKAHYISFFQDYKSSYNQLKAVLQNEHKFTHQFSAIMMKTMENTFSKIQKATDQLFGGIEELLLDGMISCSKTCENKSAGKTLGFLGLLLPMESCGKGCQSGCKPPDCGRSCQGCHGPDCGNGCHSSGC